MATLNTRKSWNAPQVTAVSSAASAQTSPVGISPDGLFQGDSTLRNINS